MKNTGIIRRIDNLGRVVLPMELRRSLGLMDQDQVEIFTEGDRIILRRFESSCCFCGDREELLEFRGKQLCARCARKIALELHS